MDNPIITQVIEQMHDLPPNLQEQVLEFVVTLRQTNSQNSPSNAWDVLESMIGTIDAPPDWSSQHDHYLYGTPKYISKQIDVLLNEITGMDQVVFRVMLRRELKAIGLNLDDAAAFDAFAATAGYYLNNAENTDDRDYLRRILNGSIDMSEGDVSSILFTLGELKKQNHQAIEQLIRDYQ